MFALAARTLGFVRSLWGHRFLVREFARKDFKKRFSGSWLGVFWAFVNPVVMLFILWFLFTIGFKAARVGEGGIPFFVWLATAMVAWNFIAESIPASANVLHEYAFLVRKVDFRLSILPVVKIATALVVHGIFLVLLVVILLAHGFYPEWYWLQALYYLFCAVLLSLGIGWLLAALTVFVRDVAQVVAIALQFGFWLTPIFWEIGMVPEQYRFLFRFNPAWYIVEGYRKSFLYHVPLWEENLPETLWFWGLTVFFLLVGITVFRRLKVHFADVL